MPLLVAITGPIAAGKNTVADRLAELFTASGRTAVIADVDDVAAMVAGAGAYESGLWFAAHEAHGALVARWLQTAVDLVIAVGPFHTQEERDLIFTAIPADTQVLRVLIDAPIAVTWERVQGDPLRGRSRQRDIHLALHERFRSLVADIPTDLTFDSSTVSADDIAIQILRHLDSARS